MVDGYGRWTEEKDYSTYPKEKWCDYDRMAVWVRSEGYEPLTSMGYLIDMMFLHYETALPDWILSMRAYTPSSASRDSWVPRSTTLPF